MRFRVSLKDGIDLLVDADKEVDAVRQAKELKDKLSAVAINDSVVADGVDTHLPNVYQNNLTNIGRDVAAVIKEYTSGTSTKEKVDSWFKRTAVELRRLASEFDKGIED